MHALFGTGLLVAIAVIFGVLIGLELVLGGGVRWLPSLVYAVILAPILLTVVAEARRSRS